MTKETQQTYEQTKHLSVLFVEDEEQLRTWTAEMLEDYFYRVDVAEDGIDALQRYKNYHHLKGHYYDIVISDIQMPRMNGIQLTKTLYELRPDQPIVILSAHTETSNLLALINMGVAQFITKPIQYHEMISVLGRVAQKINALPKETPSMTPFHLLDLGDNAIWDKEKKVLTHNRLPITLTKYEIYLMDLLTSKFEHVCSNEEILNHFFLNDIDISSESLRGMMMRLRKKLPEHCLSSIYGLGYRLSTVKGG